MAPNAARTSNCKTCNSPVEYPSRESKHYTEQSEGNMFNPMFKGNVWGETSREVRIYFRKPKRVVMVGLKLTHWTLRYEVEISNFSKLAVFKKLWDDLSDKFQAFYTFICRNLCKPGININAGLMAWTLWYGQLMENMFGTVFKISFWKAISPGKWTVSPG